MRLILCYHLSQWNVGRTFLFPLIGVGWIIGLLNPAFSERFLHV